MALPALIYFALNAGRETGGHGAWAVPTATDIAFALAALSAASRRLPASLRVFLLTLAMADDLGAVGLISVLFSQQLHPWPIAGAALTLAAMAGLGRWRGAPFQAYGLGFVLAWAFTLKSGAPTSLVAVLAAFTVPIGGRKRAMDGMVQQMMQSLHPYVAYLILPLFAFAAAGFSLRGASLGVLASPRLLGVAAGLFLGKQIGVFLATLVAATLGLGRKPTGATWLEIYGVSLLCGVGFTMSLYIGALAVPSSDLALQSQVRIGVALGSLLSGMAGMAILSWAGSRRAEAAGRSAP